jgi:hypothetical protein
VEHPTELAQEVLMTPSRCFATVLRSHPINCISAFVGTSHPTIITAQATVNNSCSTHNGCNYASVCSCEHSPHIAALQQGGSSGCISGSRCARRGEAARGLYMPRNSPQGQRGSLRREGERRAQAELCASVACSLRMLRSDISHYTLLIHKTSSFISLAAQQWYVVAVARQQ